MCILENKKEREQRKKKGRKEGRRRERKGRRKEGIVASCPLRLKKIQWLPMALGIKSQLLCAL